MPKLPIPPDGEINFVVDNFAWPWDTPETIPLCARSRRMQSCLGALGTLPRPVGDRRPHGPAGLRGFIANARGLPVEFGHAGRRRGADDRDGGSRRRPSHRRQNRAPRYHAGGDATPRVGQDAHLGGHTDRGPKRGRLDRQSGGGGRARVCSGNDGFAPRRHDRHREGLLD